ncbi:MAG: aminotransferase class IV [Saprospiraceae bacterium]
MPETTTLLESICLKDGQMPLLPFHQERVNRSRRQLFGIKQQLNLSRFLQNQALPTSGYHKIRLIYSRSIKAFSCIPYQPKPVQTLRIVATEPIEYRYKFEDRKALETAFSYRNGCDDVIITWNGYLTDVSYGNLALWDGQKWWTPAHPLLKGVRREQLIRSGKITPTIIRVPDLQYFKEVRIINALLPLEDSPSIPVTQIFLPRQY